MANKRVDIMEATISEYVRVGELLSTVDVARIAGCSQSLVFRYYPDKSTLIGASFDMICSEIRKVLEVIEFPKDDDGRSVSQYILKVWDAYIGYLMSNSVHARAYLALTSAGYKLPSRYGDPKKVVQRILRDHDVDPNSLGEDFGLLSQYIIVMSNAIAVLLADKDQKELERIMPRIQDMVMNGLSSSLGDGVPTH